jgi:hypothetical protein
VFVVPFCSSLHFSRGVQHLELLHAPGCKLHDGDAASGVIHVHVMLCHYAVFTLSAAAMLQPLDYRHQMTQLFRPADLLVAACWQNRDAV